MKFIDKLERKLGRFAISNLTTYIIIGYVIGYVLQIIALLTKVNLLSWLTLDPYLIFRGQIWRLFTWVLTPPSDFGIFTLIMLFFYYSIGNQLEQTLGRFRYNLYIFSGILMTVIGVIVMYFVYGFLILPNVNMVDASGVPLTNVDKQMVFSYTISALTSTYYLCLSIFLAFAVCYPNMRVLVYFIIPVKMKWLAILDGVFLLISFVLNPWVIRILILISMLNFIIFFISARNFRRVSPKEIHRKQQFYRQVRPSPNITRHKCAICGRTEETAPELTFRFCSKCNGNYEYCQDHLFSHQHVQ